MWSAVLTKGSASRRSAPPVVKSVTPGQMGGQESMTSDRHARRADGKAIDLNAVPPVAIRMVACKVSRQKPPPLLMARRLNPARQAARFFADGSLRNLRPDAMEQLACSARFSIIPTLPDRLPARSRRSRKARIGSRKTRRLTDVGADRYRRPHHARTKEMMGRSRGDQNRRQPARSAASRGREHRPGSGSTSQRTRSMRASG